jgi:hypothetical protein
LSNDNARLSCKANPISFSMRIFSYNPCISDETCISLQYRDALQDLMTILPAFMDLSLRPTQEHPMYTILALSVLESIGRCPPDPIKARRRVRRHLKLLYRDCERNKDCNRGNWRGLLLDEKSTKTFRERQIVPIHDDEIPLPVRTNTTSSDGIGNTSFKSRDSTAGHCHDDHVLYAQDSNELIIEYMHMLPYQIFEQSKSSESNKQFYNNSTPIKTMPTISDIRTRNKHEIYNENNKAPSISQGGLPLPRNQSYEAFSDLCKDSDFDSESESKSESESESEDERINKTKENQEHYEEMWQTRTELGAVNSIPKVRNHVRKKTDEVVEDTGKGSMDSSSGTWMSYSASMSQDSSEHASGDSVSSPPSLSHSCARLGCKNSSATWREQKWTGMEKISNNITDLLSLEDATISAWSRLSTCHNITSRLDARVEMLDRCRRLDAFTGMRFDVHGRVKDWAGVEDERGDNNGLDFSVPLVVTLTVRHLEITRRNDNYKSQDNNREDIPLLCVKTNCMISFGKHGQSHDHEHDNALHSERNRDASSQVHDQVQLWSLKYTHHDRDYGQSRGRNLTETEIECPCHTVTLQCSSLEETRQLSAALEYLIAVPREAQNPSLSLSLLAIPYSLSSIGKVRERDRDTDKNRDGQLDDMLYQEQIMEESVAFASTERMTKTNTAYCSSKNKKEIDHARTLYQSFNL